MGAGRTDTGVHAKEMFAHFDFETPFDVQNLVHKLNSYLPKDIVVYTIIPVHDEAHTRFDATKRTYEYHINTFKDAFLQEQSWYFHQKLDVELMNEAAQILFQHTDFQCFSKVNTDVNTFDCTIFEAYWTRGTAEQENGKSGFHDFGQSFFTKYGSLYCGNIGKHRITQDYISRFYCHYRK